MLPDLSNAFIMALHQKSLAQKARCCVTQLPVTHRFLLSNLTMPGIEVGCPDQELSKTDVLWTRSQSSDVRKKNTYETGGEVVPLKRLSPMGSVLRSGPCLFQVSNFVMQSSSYHLPPPAQLWHSKRAVQSGPSSLRKGEQDPVTAAQHGMNHVSKKIHPLFIF